MHDVSETGPEFFAYHWVKCSFFGEGGEAEGTLLCSQEPSAGQCSEPVESIPNSDIAHGVAVYA